MWSALSPAANGFTAPVVLPRAVSISPDGSHYIHSTEPSSVGAVTFQMRLASTCQALSEFQGHNASIVWKGNVAAMASGPRTDEVTSAGSAQQLLVIVDGSTVKTLPLP